MRNYSNISAMLGSFNNSNSSSFSLTDYSLIKSGSYGKLMKAYYAKPDADKKTKPTISNVYNKLSEATDKTGLTKMKANADALSKTADKLASSDMWKDGVKRETVEGAVKNFVKDYNSVIDQHSEVKTNQVDNSMRWMTGLTNTMSKALSKIGIEVGSDNKLTINEDTLGKAAIKDIKSMFAGDYSYGGQIESKATSIANAAGSVGIYNSQAAYANTLQSMFSVGI